MLNLSSYIADADVGAKSRTMGRIRTLQSQQERFRTEYKALAAQMQTDYGYSPVDSYYIESAAKSAVDAVLKTVQNNLDAAAQNLDLWMKDETWPRVTFVSSEIAGAGFDGDFMQQAKKRLA